MGFKVQGVSGLGFQVWVFRFRGQGLGFRVTVSPAMMPKRVGSSPRTVLGAPRKSCSDAPPALVKAVAFRV